eukprot:g11708.t1
MVNFGSNILMTLCQTALMDALTPAGAFFLYLALALVSKVFVAYMPVLEAPPGNFTKEEHTEEKEPVETVQAIPLSEKEARGEETETKKKKRKRKHRSGPSTKKEKRKKKKVQAEEEEQAGARSTAAPVEDLTTTQEEKDLQVHENPKKFELKPAPKGTLSRSYCGDGHRIRRRTTWGGAYSRREPVALATRARGRPLRFSSTLYFARFAPLVSECSTEWGAGVEDSGVTPGD